MYNEQESLPEFIRYCTDTAACATLDASMKFCWSTTAAAMTRRECSPEAAEAEGSHVVAVLLNRNYGQHSAIMALSATLPAT